MRSMSVPHPPWNDYKWNKNGWCGVTAFTPNASYHMGRNKTSNKNFLIKPSIQLVYLTHYQAFWRTRWYYCQYPAVASLSWRVDTGVHSVGVFVGKTDLVPLDQSFILLPQSFNPFVQLCVLLFLGLEIHRWRLAQRGGGLGGVRRRPVCSTWHKLRENTGPNKVLGKHRNTENRNTAQSGLQHRVASPKPAFLTHHSCLWLVLIHRWPTARSSSGEEDEELRISPLVALYKINSPPPLKNVFCLRLLSLNIWASLRRMVCAVGDLRGMTVSKMTKSC